MLARAAHATAACLLLAITSLAATVTMTGCPKVVAPLSPAPLVDVQPLEADVEEVAIADTGDESGNGMNDGHDDDDVAACDGAADNAAMVKRATAFFVTGDNDGGLACL